MARSLVIGAVALAVVVAVSAQTAGPVLSSLFGGASVVNGKAASGSAPIAIYDLSFQEKTKIGQADTTEQDGSFSTAVRPPLVTGHQIVAIDRNGNAGHPTTVE